MRCSQERVPTAGLHQHHLTRPSSFAGVRVFGCRGSRNPAQPRQPGLPAARTRGQLSPTAAAPIARPPSSQDDRDVRLTLLLIMGAAGRLGDADSANETESEEDRVAYFGMGCFWGAERAMGGLGTLRVGYMGGSKGAWQTAFAHPKRPYPFHNQMQDLRLFLQPILLTRK